MTCIPFKGGIVCVADAEGSAVVNGKPWRWEYDFGKPYGPLFIKKDGSPRKNQNPSKAVWDAFSAWLERQRGARDAKVIR